MKRSGKKQLFEVKTGNFRVKTPGLTENIIGGKTSLRRKKPELT